MKIKFIFFLQSIFHSLILTVLFSSTSNSQVILSEIMFDPIGSEYYNEFIEIYNTSQIDTIDLAGWQISDSSDADFIISYEHGTKLIPQQYAIILDAGYFENSDQYENLIPQEALILTIDDGALGSRGLSNSYAEPIILISSDGDTVAKYRYSLDNQPGYSDEKRNLLGDDSPGNWANSKLLNGTPGFRNSNSPANFDLEITAINFIPYNPFTGGEITISVLITNVGYSAISGFQLSCFIDLNQDKIFQDDEQIGELLTISEFLERGDSVIVTIPFMPNQSGIYSIGATVASEKDVNSFNDTYSTMLSIGFEKYSLVINEIMYSPPSGQPEWVELYNPQDISVDVQNWSFSDSDSGESQLITQNRFKLAPQSFLLLSADSSILDFYDINNSLLMIIKNWQRLNDDMDCIFIFDANQNVIDGISYTSKWGGNDGVSLERINPKLASNDSSNWSSYVLRAQGGTPGQRNSIFVEVLPNEAELSISPNPFSPDGDGRDDFTIINYQLPFNLSQIHVKIFDIRGRQVRFLVNNQPSGTSNSITWDGRDDKGLICRMGIYIVYLEAIHYQRGVVKSLKKSVVLAKKL